MWPTQTHLVPPSQLLDKITNHCTDLVKEWYDGSHYQNKSINTSPLAWGVINPDKTFHVINYILHNPWGLGRNLRGFPTFFVAPFLRNQILHWFWPSEGKIQVNRKGRCPNDILTPDLFSQISLKTLPSSSNWILIVRILPLSTWEFFFRTYHERLILLGTATTFLWRFK